jgi:hypothetical protein
VHLGRRHAPHVGHRAVGHEPPAKALDVTVHRVLAGFKNDNSEWLSHGTPAISPHRRSAIRHSAGNAGSGEPLKLRIASLPQSIVETWADGTGPRVMGPAPKERLRAFSERHAFFEDE